MDLRKAFDLINHDLLIEKLACYHLTESSLEWFRSYLKNRKQFVKLNNHNSSELVICSGVPQGSILGPVLFIIFMNDISLSQVSDPLLSWYMGVGRTAIGILGMELISYFRLNYCGTLAEN